MALAANPTRLRAPRFFLGSFLASFLYAIMLLWKKRSRQHRQHKTRIMTMMTMTKGGTAGPPSEAVMASGPTAMRIGSSPGLAGNGGGGDGDGGGGGGDGGVGGACGAGDAGEGGGRDRHGEWMKIDSNPGKSRNCLATVVVGRFFATVKCTSHVVVPLGTAMAAVRMTLAASTLKVTSEAVTLFPETSATFARRGPNQEVSE